MTGPDAGAVRSAATLAAQFAGDLVALRHRLHEQPETGLHLPRTQRAVLEALAGLDVELTLGRGLSSVVGVIRGQAAGDPGASRPVVLLRGDMDALPVAEETGLPYASTRPGVMHACGHDLHVAGLVGAARILDALRDQLAGDVVLMFQPAEEGPGGAAPMIAEGLLAVAGARVDAAYAAHVISAGYPHGMWWGRPGATMAAADELAITVHGRGGHGSAPHNALDPVPVACEIVLALQSMVTRRFSAFDPVVVTVGRISGGTRNNVIADTAVVDTTIRTLSREHRALAMQLIPQVAEHVAAAHGLTVTIEPGFGYPVTVNDPGELAFAKETVLDLFGADRWTDMPHPEAGSEDFSFVLDEVPGAYVYLSAVPSGVDHESADDNHSPRAHFDDAAVPDLAILLAELALRRCRRADPPSAAPGPG